MKNAGLKTLFFLVVTGFALVGCYKDDTEYYPDEKDPEIAIFSNKGNNLMSCFIDGKAWRTNSRIFSVFSRPRYEVYLNKQQTNSALDTLTIMWEGYYSNNKDLSGNVSLVLPVSKNFTFRDLSALQGQRLNIDTTNGYFTTGIAELNMNNARGRGSIYFHSVRVDSTSPGTYTGTMSGLFEADFNSFKILKGRFDHNIVPEQVNF